MNRGKGREGKGREGGESSHLISSFAVRIFQDLNHDYFTE